MILEATDGDCKMCLEALEYSTKLLASVPSFSVASCISKMMIIEDFGNLNNNWKV